jgi:hypothetical protein
VGVGVGVAVGVALGAGSGAGTGVGVAEGLESGVGLGCGVGVGVAEGLELGEGLGIGLGLALGVGVGVGVGFWNVLTERLVEKSPVVAKEYANTPITPETTKVLTKIPNLFFIVYLSVGFLDWQRESRDTFLLISLISALIRLICGFRRCPPRIHTSTANVRLRFTPLPIRRRSARLPNLLGN